MRTLSALITGFSVFFAVGTATAQTDLERATARDAANNGRAAYDAGKYEKAIDYLSRAESLVHSPTHLLFLARTQAKLGRLVAAHETYLKITRETLAPNAPKAFVAAQDAAEQEQDTLDARIPSVTVSLKGVTTNDVIVQMDGTNLPPAMIGIPLPADPGEHTFKASGSTVVADPVTVKLAEAGKQTVTLTLRSNGMKPVAAAAPKPVKAAVGESPPTADTTPTAATTQPAAIDVTTTPPPNPSNDGGTSGLRVASYVALGLGAVGIGVGSYFLVKSRSTSQEADDIYQQCQRESMSSKCSVVARKLEYEAKDNDASSQRNLGIGVLVGGGVGVIAGITMLIVDSGNSTKSASNEQPRFAPVLGFNTVGVAGTF